MNRDRNMGGGGWEIRVKVEGSGTKKGQGLTPASGHQLLQVRRLLEERESILNDKGSLAIGELDKEVKKSKAEFEEVMKEMGEMKKQQVGGIAETSENMETMCLDVGGYVKKVEQHIKELEEELESAQESQNKLREELQIAKNDEVKKS